MPESTLLLLIQDGTDVARGAAILRGEVPVPPGLETIQLFVSMCLLRTRMS